MSDVGSGEGIDLDFGGVSAITGFVPVPTGAYTLMFRDVTIESTKDNTGKNVVVSMVVCDGPLEGRTIGKDRWYVPNRLVQEAKKYETTAGYFKGRLEAVFDKPIGDSFKLNVREMVGMKFKGIVMLVDEGYGPQNKVTAYLPLSADLANVVIPAPSAPRQPSNGGSAGEAAGRFRI